MVWDGTTGPGKAVVLVFGKLRLSGHPLFNLAITVHLSIFHRSSYATRTATVVIIKILQPRDKILIFRPATKRACSLLDPKMGITSQSVCAVVLRMLALSLGLE